MDGFSLVNQQSNLYTLILRTWISGKPIIFAPTTESVEKVVANSVVSLMRFPA
jgi:hypothetical protein